MDNINVYLMYPSMHYQPATFYSDVNCDTDLKVQGKCVVGSPSVSESALQVCNYRTVLPTQYGVHAGCDWAEFPGSSNCGINICADNTVVSHIDFSYVGNTNYYNGQITYDNSANTMQFFTNQVKGMVLHSQGRLTLGSYDPLGSSTLYVSGGSYMLGNLSVNGSITTPQNMYFNGVNSKIGIAWVQPRVPFKRLA
jgi:hypothetical protein